MTQKPEESEVEPRRPDDYERTLSWVEERFRELGYNDFQAIELAESGADWHYTKFLLDRGCDLETALDLSL